MRAEQGRVGRPHCMHAEAIYLFMLFAVQLYIEGAAVNQLHAARSGTHTHTHAHTRT